MLILILISNKNIIENRIENMSINPPAINSSLKTPVKYTVSVLRYIGSKPSIFLPNII